MAWHGALGRYTLRDRDMVEEALEVISTTKVVEQAVDTLSGGERQRSGSLMMLAQDAALLLLDEPISALDVGHQLEVLGLVEVLCRKKNISAVIVLHDVNIAATFCHRIVALQRGSLIADGVFRKRGK